MKEGRNKQTNELMNKQTNIQTNKLMNEYSKSHSKLTWYLIEITQIIYPFFVIIIQRLES